MNRFICLLICLFFTCNLLHSQYRENKQYYDFRNYTRQPSIDKYNPALAGVASLVVPGLGQIMAGEPGRGLIFFGSCLGFAGLSVAGYMILIEYIFNDLSGPDIIPGAGFVLMLSGAGGVVYMLVWSAIDAVRVAKVNNLAWRDRNKVSPICQLQPYFGSGFTTNKSSIPVGITLRVHF